MFLLRPHHKNFNKRLIKTPKLYFIDTGLLCYLLRIRSPQDLAIHNARGVIFENFVIAELLKNLLNRSLDPNIYFWRDSQGHEIDLLIDLGNDLIPVEIKSGQTVAADFFKGLDYWRSLTKLEDAAGSLVYGGERSYRRRGFVV